MRKLICAVAVLIAFAAGPALAAEAPPFPKETATELVSIRDRLSAVEQLAAKGVIANVEAGKAADHYLAEASKVAGRPMTRDDLAKVKAPSTAPDLTVGQRIGGFFTFMNIVWVLAALGLAGAFIYLFGSYIAQLMKYLTQVPLAFYEGVFYLLGLGVLGLGLTLSAATGPFVGLTGCLLFGGALGFTAKHRSMGGSKAKFTGICFVVWAAAALCYQSSLIGFAAVIALFATLGFSAAMTPLCYYIGFKDDAAIGRGTAAAFVLLALFAGLRVAGEHLLYVGAFEAGALWMGGLVGYLGLLITASRWYDRKKRSYALFQVITPAACLIGVWLGSIYGISELQKFGGTFLVLFLLEKILDIPTEKRRGRAAVILVASAAAFAFCLYVKANPEALRPYLPI